MTSAHGPKAKIATASGVSAVEARPDIAETRPNRRESGAGQIGLLYILYFFSEIVISDFPSGVTVHRA